MKPKTKPDCDDMNNTEDNIDNSEGNDWNDNIEDELYIWEDHFEGIFVEKSYKKKKS